MPIYGQKQYANLDAPLDPHGLCGEVGVAASTIPVASHRLGVKGNYHTEVFSNTLKVFIVTIESNEDSYSPGGGSG